MKVNVLRADPAGNITLFVLSPVHREERPAVAGRLMEIADFRAEQVGFVCPLSRGPWPAWRRPAGSSAATPPGPSVCTPPGLTAACPSPWWRSAAVTTR